MLPELDVKVDYGIDGLGSNGNVEGEKMFIITNSLQKGKHCSDSEYVLVFVDGGDVCVYLYRKSEIK